MDAREAKIRLVVEGRKQFIVPHFQRPYSWQLKQWEDLWADIVGVVEEEGNPAPHFIGSLVTAPGRSVPEGVEKRLLIDGQQRVTTLLVLFMSIRDFAKSTQNERTAREIQEDYLTNRFEEGDERYKLLPTQGDGSSVGDREVFKKLVDRDYQGGDLVQSFEEYQDVGIFQAYRFFFRKVSHLSGRLSVEALFKGLMVKVAVVSIVLDDRDNPNRIFESLNGKGRALSQADLIRNFFFMRIEVSQQERAYRDLWLPMQKHLGDETVVTNFIRHFLMSDGEVVREGDVYSTLKSRVDGRSENPLQYLKKLNSWSVFYPMIREPGEELRPVVAKRLRNLNRIDVSVVYPFLLKVVSDWHGRSLSEADFVEALEVVENFVVRRLVCGVPSHGLNKIFVPLYSQVRGRASLVAGLKAVLSTKDYPKDKQFVESLVQSRMYGAGERKTRLKFVLERIEHSVSGNEVVDFSDLTIEHVMPQTLSAAWSSVLGENFEEEFESVVHTLGNLTLTGWNSDLSNSSFEKKKEIYALSRLALNEYFDQKQTWGFAEIEERGLALANQAVRVWAYFGLDAVEASGVGSSVTGSVPSIVEIFGVVHQVSQWNDVLFTVMDAIATSRPDEFHKVLDEMSRCVNRDRSYFTRSSRTRQLSNGAFVGTTLSAQAIYRNCVQATALVGLSKSDWKVVYHRRGA